MLHFKMQKSDYYRLIGYACMLVCVFAFISYQDTPGNAMKKIEVDLRDIRPLVEEVLSGKKPAVSPVNSYPYKFLTNTSKCSTLEKLNLVIIVKSAIGNIKERNALRKIYGQEDLVPGIIIRTLFFLGVDTPNSETQKLVDTEIAEFDDIIQMDFYDSFYNNTIKTIMSLQWLTEHCSTADYYLFTIIDDKYISVRRFLDYTLNYTFTNEICADDKVEYAKDSICYAGFVLNFSARRLRSITWKSEIKYDLYKMPKYVDGNAYILSNRCMKMLYTGSLFVKILPLDDIYLGIVAKKVGLNLTNRNGVQYRNRCLFKDPFRGGHVIIGPFRG